MQKNAKSLKDAADALRKETKTQMAEVPSITKELGDTILAKIQGGFDDLQKVCSMWCFVNAPV